MKTILLTLALLLTSSVTFGATIKKDNKGNYYEVTTVKKNEGKATNKTFKDSKGNTYKVYEGPKGGHYYYAKDKQGKEVKKYLPRDNKDKK